MSKLFPFLTVSVRTRSSLLRSHNTILFSKKSDFPTAITVLARHFSESMHKNGDETEESKQSHHLREKIKSKIISLVHQAEGSAMGEIKHAANKTQETMTRAAQIMNNINATISSYVGGAEHKGNASSGEVDKAYDDVQDMLKKTTEDVTETFRGSENSEQSAATETEILPGTIKKTDEAALRGDATMDDISGMNTDMHNAAGERNAATVDSTSTTSPRDTVPSTPEQHQEALTAESRQKYKGVSVTEGSKDRVTDPHTVDGLLIKIDDWLDALLKEKGDIPHQGKVDTNRAEHKAQ